MAEDITEDNEIRLLESDHGCDRDTVNGNCHDNHSKNNLDLVPSKQELLRENYDKDDGYGNTIIEESYSKTQKLHNNNYNEEEHGNDQNHKDIETSDKFEDLLGKCPSNVILKILGYLGYKELVHSVSLVCKSWHEMAFEPDLWCEIDLRNYVINDIVLSKLPQLCSFIKYILLPDATNDDLTDDGLIALALGCPKLRTFYAPRSGSKFSDKPFVAFAEHCPHLKMYVLDCLDITDRTMNSIARNLHELEHLSVSQSDNITNEGVAEVIKRCRNLKILNVNQNKQITEECLVTIPQSSCSLTRLEMLMCSVDHNGVAVIGELRNLQLINLSQCVDLTSEDLIPILQGCQNLMSISLNLDKKIDDKSIDVILTHLPNLEQIFLVSTKLTDEGLCIMGQKGKKLNRIDIGYTKVTEIGARIVSENCPCLNYLGLMRCDQIKEEEVEKLIVEYPHITYSTFIQDTKRLLKKAELDWHE